MSISWKFYDPVLDETYFLNVNPNSESSGISVNKSVKYASSAGIDGNVLMALGPNDIVTISLGGFVYSESEYNQFIYWASKDANIQITDDIDRIFDGYIKSYSLTRIPRSRRFPWKHEYKLDMLLKSVEV